VQVARYNWAQLSLRRWTEISPLPGLPYLHSIQALSLYLKPAKSSEIQCSPLRYFSTMMLAYTTNVFALVIILFCSVMARPFLPDGHHSSLGPMASQHDHIHDVGSPTAQLDLDKWADSLLVDEPDQHQQYHSSSIRSSSTLHPLPHQLSPQHSNGQGTTLMQNHHSSDLDVVSPVVTSNHYHQHHSSPLITTPRYPTSLIHNIGQAASSSHDHGSPPGHVADWLKWIEDELMRGPDHDSMHPSPRKSLSPARFPLSPSSGLSNAGMSDNADLHHDDHSTSTSIEQQRIRLSKPQKKRWTANYNVDQQHRIRDAIDSIVIQRMGPGDPKQMQKRRHNIMLRLNEKDIDDLANGRSLVSSPWSRKARKQRQGKPRERTYKPQWTNGFRKPGVAAINQFFENEVKPHIRASSSGSKNNLIRELNRSELLAIQDNNQVEKKRIVEKLAASAGPKGAPRVRSNKKQMEKKM
jgi:hypothetical protein